MPAITPLDHDDRSEMPIILTDRGFVLVSGFGTLNRRRWGHDVRRKMEVGVPVEVPGKATVDVSLGDGQSATYEIDGAAEPRMLQAVAATAMATIGTFATVLAILIIAQGPIVSFGIFAPRAAWTTQELHHKIATEAAAETPGFTKLTFDENEMDQAKRFIQELKEEAR